MSLEIESSCPQEAHGGLIFGCELRIERPLLCFT
jgi:hypothetical protein